MLDNWANIVCIQLFLGLVVILARMRSCEADMEAVLTLYA